MLLDCIVGHRQVIQGVLDDRSLGGFGKDHLNTGAGIGLINQMPAAAQVQAQFQTQRAVAAPVKIGKAGKADVDVRKGQGRHGKAQDKQYKDG